MILPGSPYQQTILISQSSSSSVRTWESARPCCAILNRAEIFAIPLDNSVIRHACLHITPLGCAVQWDWLGVLLRTLFAFLSVRRVSAKIDSCVRTQINGAGSDWLIYVDQSSPEAYPILSKSCACPGSLVYFIPLPFYAFLNFRHLCSSSI